MLIVDPSEGWLYGFPKAFTFIPSHPSLPGEDYDKECKQWFLDEGYIPSYDGWYSHMRFWYHDPD